MKMLPTTEPPNTHNLSKVISKFSVCSQAAELASSKVLLQVILPDDSEIDS